MVNTGAPRTDKDWFRYRTTYWVMPEKREIWVNFPCIRQKKGIPYRFRVTMCDMDQIRRFRAGGAVDEADLVRARLQICSVLAYVYFVPEGGWLEEADSVRLESPFDRLAERENPEVIEESAT